MLKSEQFPSLRAAAPLLGFSLGQLYRRWALYQQGGIDALLASKPYGHAHLRLTESAWDGLCAAMRAGEIATLNDAQCSLAEQWQISYCLSGL